MIPTGSISSWASMVASTWLPMFPLPQTTIRIMAHPRMRPGT